MGFTVTGIRLGNPERERFIERALGTVRTPAHEGWLAKLTHGEDRSWDLLLIGPPRDPDRHLEWEVTPIDADRSRYRRMFFGHEQSTECLRRTMRELLWDWIVFHENPLFARSPDQARAFEEAVWTVLTRDDCNEPVEVRFDAVCGAADEWVCVCGLDLPTRHISVVRVASSPHDLARELLHIVTPMAAPPVERAVDRPPHHPTMTLGDHGLSGPREPTAP